MSNASTSLAQRTRFDDTRVRFDDYTRTLLEEALRSSTINEEMAQKVEAGILDALGNMIGMYTEGLSSSVANEIAEELLSSLLYTVDAVLMQCGSHAAALRRLISEPAYDLYLEGMKVLRRHVIETTGLYVRLKRTRLAIPMPLYQDTILEVIPGALKIYDIKFASHRTRYTFDYPLACGRIRLRGIYHLRAYVQSLTTENRICREFGMDEVQRLTVLHCRRQGIPVQEANFNLLSNIFPNALIADYLQKDYGTLIVSRSDCESAEKLLSGFGKEEQTRLLTECAKRLSYSDPVYCSRVLQTHLPSLLSAVECRTLRNYLITED